MHSLAHYLHTWRLNLDGKPFETGSSQIAYVTRGATKAVLKLAKPNSDERGMGRVLRHWESVAVPVLEEDDHALLLGRAWPGTPLSTLTLAGDDDRATHILCDVIEGLRDRPVPDGNWKTVEDWTKAFARVRRLPPHPLLTAGWIDRGEAEYRALCRSSSRRSLLHGDLHHANVLKDELRGWLVIDPKGVVGDLAFETATALHNPYPHVELYADTKVMEHRVKIFASRLGLDPVRILRCFFAQALLSAAWHLEDGTGDVQIANMLRAANTAEALLAAQ